MDGDGQHDPADIQKLIEPILNNHCDVVLGTRLKKPQGMPIHKRFYNFIANLLTWYLFGLWVTDSQSGFRAYSKKAAQVIEIRCDGYENASEIIREIYTKKLKYKEVPIRVIYTAYSQGKVKKQNLANGFQTLYKMFWKLIN
jgi:hypothetical protein